MFSFAVKGKEYKIQFGYGTLCETDILDRLGKLGNSGISEAMQLLPEMLLAGLQKRHSDEFGYETEEEKKTAIRKVYDLLDEYEDEGTEEAPKSGFDLYESLNTELEKNGFLSGMLNNLAKEQAKEKNATKIPQDHKAKK